MARPFTQFPPGARNHLEAMAQNGLLSESAAATSLGMPLRELQRVIRDHVPSKQTWESCLAIERDVLLKALFQKAMEGDAGSARTLLAVRHGMSEKSPTGAAERVSVTFILPAAQTVEAYTKAIQQPKVEQLAHDDDATA